MGLMGIASPARSELALNLDASDTSTINGGTILDGQTVTSWGQAHGTTAGSGDLTASGAPKWYASGLNSRPSIRLDGVDDYFSATGFGSFINSDNWTVLFVADTNDAAQTNQTIFANPNGYTSTGGGLSLRYENTSWAWRAHHRDPSGGTSHDRLQFAFFDHDSDPGTAKKSGGLDEAALRGFATDGTDFFGYYNELTGSAQAPDPSSNTTLWNTSSALYIGTRSNLDRLFDGDISQIVAFDRQLTSTELKDVQQALSDKWGLGFNSGGNATAGFRLMAPFKHHPGLTAWYEFETGSGTNAVDTSSSNYDGVLTDGPTWTNDSTQGWCLSYDGVDDYVNVPDYDAAGTITISLWLKMDSQTSGGSVYRTILSNAPSNGEGIQLNALTSDTTGELRLLIGRDNGKMLAGEDNSMHEYLIGTLGTSGWHHVVLICDQNTGELTTYLDSTKTDHGSSNRHRNSAYQNLRIGGDAISSRRFKGLIDDVRIFDYAMTPADVDRLLGTGYNKAWHPTPKNNAASDGVTNVTLEWESGDLAATHDVYFGTNSTSVANADTNSSEYKGNQNATTYNAGTLSADTQYYWRIDEVSSDTQTVWTGDVWAMKTPFTTTRNYYVATTGDDEDPGTQSQPFATIAKAKEVTRGDAPYMGADIIINIAPGDYLIDETLTLAELDSGQNGFKVTYKSTGAPGSARLIGGQQLTGWTYEGSNIWKITVPNSQEFETLYESGARAIKAREPNLSTAYPNSFPLADNIYFISEDGSPQPSGSGTAWMKYYSADLDLTGMTIGQMKINIFPRGDKNWNRYHRPVDTIDAVNRIIEFGSININVDDEARYFLEDHYDFLDSPGEFYLDKSTSTLYYYPMEPRGNTDQLDDLDIVMPVVKDIFRLINAHHIVFEGLALEYTDYFLSDGYQSKLSFGNDHAMIYLVDSDYIEITDCHLKNAGRHAIVMLGGCSYNTVSGCWMEQLGFNGVAMSNEIVGTSKTLEYNTV